MQDRCRAPALSFGRPRGDRWCPRVSNQVHLMVAAPLHRNSAGAVVDETRVDVISNGYQGEDRALHWRPEHDIDQN